MIPTCYRFGLGSNDTGLPQITTSITTVAAGALNHWESFNPLRLVPCVFVADEFNVAIHFEEVRIQSTKAMEFARCPAANRLMANNSYPTNFMGKVVSYENPHRIRHPR